MQGSLVITTDTYESTTFTDVSIAQVSLPPTLFGNVASSRVGIIFSVYKDAGFFPLKNDSQEGISIGTPVVAATIAGEKIFNLTEPVRIVLRLQTKVILHDQHVWGSYSYPFTSISLSPCL